MAVTQAQTQQQRVLVEERFFDIQIGQTGSLFKQALEEAAGMELEELAPGMWTGRKQLSRWASLNVTARAQAVEDGTSVELRVEHRNTPGALGLFILLIIVASVAILPLIPLIMYGQKTQQRQQQDRLVLMHKLWTELAEVVGAPQRGSYRESPQRVYTPRSRAKERPAEPEAPSAQRIAQPSPAAMRVADDEPTDEQAALMELDAEQAEAASRGRA